MPRQTFYTVGGTVQAGGGIYIKRTADDDLFELCRQGELAFILSSRQVGKSSLLVRTASQLEDENIRSVLIDLSAIGVKVSKDEWYQGILSEIGTALDLETDIFSWWEKYAQLGPAQRLGNFFRDVLLKEVKESVVLFFDEIDSTLSIPFADDFYTAIRATYNARSTTPDFKRLSFVLVGVATPGDLIADDKRTPFNIGYRVELKDFTLNEALPLAKGLGENNEQVLDWIFRFTSGHPYLTQCLCAYLSKSSDSVDEHAVTHAVEQLFTGEQGDQDNNLQFVRDMLAKRSPGIRNVLLTYKKIRSDKKVSDDEHSITKAHLKLSGLVRSENGFLKVRNEIYRKVFDQDWVSKNTQIDWRIIISYSFALFAIIGLITLSFLIYKDVQYISNQPKESPICFNRNPYPEKRLECLADLFQADTKIIPYENSVMARELFFSQTSWMKQRSIFAVSHPNPQDLENVISGLYTNLADVDHSGQSMKLLLVMQEALKYVGLENSELGSEIHYWIQAREKAKVGDNAGALEEYNQAIELNLENPSTLFERARIFTNLGRYEEAINDYEQIIAISPKSERESPDRPTATITSSPTSTLTFTPTGTSTLTPTSTSIPTLTSTPYFENTLTPTSGITNTPIITLETTTVPTSLPTLHFTHTPSPIPTLDDTPVQSKFLSLPDRIEAVKNDTIQNEDLNSFLTTIDPIIYRNLNEWGIIPATPTPISTPNGFSTPTPPEIIIPTAVNLSTATITSTQIALGTGFINKASASAWGEPNSQLIGRLGLDQPLILLEKREVGGSVWYRCTWEIDNTTLDGWILADNIRLGTPPINTISPSAITYDPVLVLDRDFSLADDCWENETNLSSGLEQLEGFTRRGDRNWRFGIENGRTIEQFVEVDFMQCLNGQQANAFGFNVLVARLESNREFGFFLENANGDRREYTIWLNRVDNLDRMYLRLRENNNVSDYELLLINNLNTEAAFPRNLYQFSFQVFFEINNQGLDIIYLKEGPSQESVNFEDLNPNQMLRIDNAERPTLGTPQKLGLKGYGGETQTIIWPLAFWSSPELMASLTPTSILTPFAASYLPSQSDVFSPSCILSNHARVFAQFFQGEASISAALVDNSHTGQGLRLDFSNVSNEGANYAGWEVWFGPNDQNGIDISAYNSLVFYIRGANGGEQPNIYLMMPIIDENFRRFWQDIEQVTPVTTLWQRVEIPLSNFTSSQSPNEQVDLSNVQRIQILFEWYAQPTSGRIFIDDLCVQ